MKRFFLLLITLFCLVSSVQAATQTINTLPSANSTFMSDLQMFLRDESADRDTRRTAGGIFTGGIGETAASLTHSISACIAFIDGHYVSQASVSHTYTATKRTFIYLRADSGVTPTIAAATMTYSTNFVFAEMASSTVQPATPSGTIPLFYADTGAASIDTISDLRKGTAPLSYWDTFTSALSAVSSTMQMTFIISEQYDVAATASVSANIRLDFTGGGLLSPISGTTLTIANSNKQIIANPGQQIFTGAGVIQITSGSVWAGWFDTINEAVDSGADVINLEPGTTYTVSSSISLDTEQVLQGAGWSSVLQADTGLTDPVVTNNDTTSGNTGIVVRDLKIDGNGESCAAIVFLDSGLAGYNKDILIDNVRTDYTLDRSINIQYGITCTIQNCNVTRFGALLTDGNGTAPSDDGIRISYGVDCKILNNFVSNEDLITDQHGNSLTYGRHGICLGTSGSTGNIVMGNIIKTVERHGINLEATTGKEDAGPRKSICTSNIITDAGTYGIVATSDNLIVSNNTIIESGQCGIAISSYIIGYNDIINNQVISCGGDPLSANAGNDSYIAGINAAGGYAYKNIIGNTVISSAGSGIYLERSFGKAALNTVKNSGGAGIRATSDDWIITENIIDGSWDDGITIANNLTGQIIANNRISGSSEYNIDIGSNWVGIINSNITESGVSGEINGMSNVKGYGNQPVIDFTNGGGYYIYSGTTLFSSISGVTAVWSSAIPSSSIVLGVVAYNVVSVSGTTTYAVGTSGTTDLFMSGVSITAGQTGDLSYATAANSFTAPRIFTSSTNIWLSSIDSYTAITGGTVRMVVFYIRLRPPVS